MPRNPAGISGRGYPGFQRFHPESSKNKYVRQLFSIPENHIVFLSSGIIIERKGYRDIFQILNKLDYPFTYIIAGQYSKSAGHKSSATELKEMQVCLRKKA